MTDSSSPSTGAVYGRRATRGFIWTSLYNLVGRCTSLAAQLVLGYKLAEDEYGLYAIALSASAFVLAFGGAGFPRIQIQRGDEYHRIARPLWHVALATNTATAVLLIATMPLILRFYDEPGLAPLLWIIALSVPLRTPSLMLRAKLSIDLRFREIALIASISVVIRHGLMIVFALLGFGPLSFVLPLPCLAVYEAIHTGILVGWFPKAGRLSRRLLREIFHAAKWMIIAAVSVAFITQGDYLVVGKLETRAVTGQYFFAFQLTIALLVTFTESVASVMLPSLSKLRDDPDRIRQAYARSIRTLTLVAAPVTVGAYLVIAPAIHVLWQGKWDAVGFTAQMLALSLLFRFHTALAIAVIEAYGQWRLRAVILLTDGLGTVGSAVLGAWLGGLDTIAVTVTAYRLLFGIVFAMIGSRLAGLFPHETITATLPAITLAGLLAGLVYLAFTVVIPVTEPLIRILVIGSCFSIAYMLAAYWMFRDQIDYLRSMIFSRRR